MPDGLQATEAQRAFREAMLLAPRMAEAHQAFQEALLLSRRRALIAPVRHLRRQHRAVSSAMAELRAVTNACLAMGER